MAKGGLAKLRLEMEIDGDKAVVSGLERVDAAVDRTSRTTKTATERMADSHRKMETATQRAAREMEASAGRMAQSAGAVTTATGRMAAEHTRHMNTVADNYKHAHGGMTEFEQGLMSVQMQIMNLGMAAAMISAPVVLLTQSALAMERINAQYKAVTGSATLAGEELAFLRQEAERLGLVFSASAGSYAKFMASARNTPIEGEAARRVFVGVSEAVTALKLTTEDSNGIFLALSQMMSKGKISAEELSGQLGERLPGAVKLTADAMGLTTAELLKQMQDGKLMSSDVLPKLAEELHKTYGKAALEASTQAQASMNRFKNEIFETSAAIGSKLLPKIAEYADAITELLKTWRTQPSGGFSNFLFDAVNDPLLKGKVGQYYVPGAQKDYDPQMARLKADQRYSEEVRNAERARTEREAAGKSEMEKAAAAAAKEADQQYRQYTTTLQQFNAQIRAANPFLTEHERKLLDIDAAVAKAIEVTPQYEKSLRAAGEAIKQNITLSYNMAEAIKATAAEFKHYLDEKAQQEPQHNELGGQLLRWEEELKFVDSLQPSAGIDKLNGQVAGFERLLAAFPSRAVEVANAIAKLKADFASSSGLDQTLQDNRKLEIGAAIKDPFEREKAFIKERYDTERTLQEKALKNAEKDAKLRAAIEENLALKKVKYINDITDIDYEATRSRMGVAAEYAGLVGGLFDGLASTIDQSSRDGFEAAKAMNLAAAIVSTAAAIMNQMSGGDPYTAWARAAAAGAMGAIQIAKIASTSFGGGDTSVGGITAGFSGGGAGSSSIGGSVGAPTTSIHDSQTDASLNSLAAAADNASLALGKVADGLTSIGDLFGDGSQGKLMAGGLTAPADYEPSTNFSKQNQAVFNINKSRLFDFTGNPVELFTTAINTVFTAAGFGTLFGFGNSWYTKSSGLNLGLSGGNLLARAYAEQQKDGGWFSSDKHRTDFAALDPLVRDTLDSYLNSITQTVLRSATVMGTRANLASVNLAPTNIQTSGRTPEDIEKDLKDWFTKAADTIGQSVEGLKQFAFYGESAFDAAVRLSTSLQGVNENLELIGATLIDSSLKGANAAYHLQDLFGGLDKMGEKVDAYFKAMYTEEEQARLEAAQAQRQINVAFGEMGRSVPANGEQFRSLVNTLDLATSRGQATFAALMDVSEAFGKVQDQMEKLAKYQQESVQDLTLRTLATQGKDAAAALLDLVWKQQQEIQDYLDKGLDITRLKTVQELEYQKAVRDTADTLRDAGNEMTAAADKIKQKLSESVSAQIQIMETLKNLLGGDLSTLSPQAKYEQSGSAFRAAAGRARLGDVTALQKVSQLSQQFLQASRSYNASGPAYAADFANVTQTLAELGGLPSATEIQIDVAQQQLEKLTQIQTAIGEGNIDQLVYLRGILGENSGVSELLRQYLEADQIAKAAVAQTQADTINRAAALVAFETQKQADKNAAQSAYDLAISGIQTKGAWANSGVDKARYMDMTGQYDAQYDVAPYVNGSALPDGRVDLLDAYVLKLMSPGGTLYEGWVKAATDAYSATMAEINNRTFSYAVGTPYIPFDQNANIHYGEAVVDAQSNAVLQKYGIRVMTPQRADNRETVEELKNTVAELKKSNHQLAAIVRVLQYGFQKTIAIEEIQAESFRTLASKARLADAQ
jgi:tape measure domain-containing protein